MSKDEVQSDYLSMLRGMLSPNWQKPSEVKIEHKIEAILKSVKTAKALPSKSPSPTNRRHLTALVAAGTKLDAASRLVKEATVDLAVTGLIPVEVREEIQKIAADIDTHIQRRIVSTIEHIP